MFCIFLLSVRGWSVDHVSLKCRDAMGAWHEPRTQGFDLFFIYGGIDVSRGFFPEKCSTSRLLIYIIVFVSCAIWRHLRMRTHAARDVFFFLSLEKVCLKCKRCHNLSLISPHVNAPGLLTHRWCRLWVGCDSPTLQFYYYYLYFELTWQALKPDLTGDWHPIMRSSASARPHVFPPSSPPAIYVAAL